VTLLGIGPQGADYAAHAPSGYPHWGDPLPFTYLSTGSETLFRDGADPVPVPRRAFAVHRPKALRDRLSTLPPLDPTGLRACQADAIEGVEASLRANRTRALVQMATGAGKTYTACALAHRLLSHARARRILFLVDRANLGTQTVAEFKGYQPPGSTLFFHEEFPVQHLHGRTLDRDAAVVVCTIQRLYAALRGQELDEADEEASGFEHPDGGEHQVGYSAAIPPETFDLIIVDECHRSIYGTWRQVLDYFDAFLVGPSREPRPRCWDCSRLSPCGRTTCMPGELRRPARQAGTRNRCPHSAMHSPWCAVNCGCTMISAHPRQCQTSSNYPAPPSTP